MNERYEITIKGYLDLEWDEWFPGFTISHQPQGTTLLSGTVTDQPALHGLLMRISQLGLTLLNVEQLDTEVQDE